MKKERQTQHEEDRKWLGVALQLYQWQADLGFACVDLAEMLGDEEAKQNIPQFQGQPEFHVMLMKMLCHLYMTFDFLSWLEMAQIPPPGYSYGNGEAADVGSSWEISPTSVVTPRLTEVPLYVVSDSTLFFARGGKKSKNETIMTEVEEFLGRTTKGLRFSADPVHEGRHSKRACGGFGRHHAWH